MSTVHVASLASTNDAVALNVPLERLDDAYELAELCVVMGFGHDHPSHATAGRLGLPLFALSGVCGFQTECTLGIF